MKSFFFPSFDGFNTFLFSAAVGSVPSLLLSEHGGFRLQDGLGSDVPGKRHAVVGAVVVWRRAAEPVIPPHTALHGNTPPRPPQLGLNLQGDKAESELTDWMRDGCGQEGSPRC